MGIFANNKDPDEMLQNVAFHQDLGKIFLLVDLQTLLL